MNGFPMGGSGTVGNYTMYVSPFMVVQNFKYTKHFYIEGQRILSKLGEMGVDNGMFDPKAHAGDSLKAPVKWDGKKENSKATIIANFEALGLSGAVFTAGKSGKMPYGQIKKYFRDSDGQPADRNVTSTTKKVEGLQFYYHPDHLGSSNYITDASGEVYQHQEYFPFGETFVEERNDAEYTTYLFNGKELDEETGLYYYGARYYEPRTSIWQGVDPSAENYPGWTPYNFVANNPLKIIDLDGRNWYQNNKTGEFKWFKGSDKQEGWTNFGYGLSKDANVTSTRGNGSRIYTQVTRNTLILNTIGSNKSPVYGFIYPRDLGDWGKPGSDGLIWRGCASCHAPNGAYRYAAYNSGERLAGRTYAAIMGIFGSQFITAPPTMTRAFFSGAGTEEKAIQEGFQTLGQTRAGQNLTKMTEGMLYEPGSQAYNWWARLSATYAKGVPRGSTVNVFLNNPSATGIWNTVEKRILELNKVNIIVR